MKTHHFRFIASFVLAIFLAGICAVFLAWACDSYRDAVAARERDLKDARRSLSDVENKGYMGSISQGGWWGMGIGAGAGLVVAAGSGPLAPVTAVPTVAKFAVGGGLSGAAWGAVNHRSNLQSARDNVAYYEDELAAAKQALEDCLNPPAQYTYTDHNGYVYKFSDYTAYMNFLYNRGH